MAKNREAELEGVVNRTYDGMDIPEIRAVVEAASKAMAPFIAEFDRLFAEHYPAEFARAKAGHHHHARRHPRGCAQAGAA
jgi:hypothetical protein